jgi:adenosylcobinamide-GDP ribazoletransferase
VPAVEEESAFGVSALRGAVSFLTVLPAGGGSLPAPRLGRAYFPLVGLGVGGASGLVFLAASYIVPRPVAAVAALALGALLTGGLHLDGLMDSADGLFGPSGRERRLEVMRDPRLGSFGLIAGVLVILGDFACLSSLSPRTGLFALLLTGGLSRLAMLTVVVALPYVRTAGLGVSARGRGGALDIALGAVCALIPAVFVGPRALGAAAGAAAGALAVSLLAWRRLGGATGDIYGATVELSQLGALVAFAAAPSPQL